MAPPDWTPLNWKEIALLVSGLKPEVEGLFLDRIVVAERPRFPQGYIKGEWVLRLSGRRQECCLVFSVRPRHPYLALIRGKGPKAAASGTHSPFDLAISKALRGAKLDEIQALERERTVVLWFSSATESARLGLVINLIPAIPEALLVTDSGNWKLLARSRTVSKPQAVFVPPDGSKAPTDLPVRDSWFKSPETYWEIVDKKLDAEAFDLRLKAAQKAIREQIETAVTRIRQNETALTEAHHEPDWSRYGELMKASLGNVPPVSNGKRALLDYSTGETVEIPSDPKLNPSQQVERFYQLARRKERRIEEAKLRLENFRERKNLLERKLTELAPGDWERLEQLERAAQISPQPAAGKKRQAWPGKSFSSKDGWTIWVGRSKDENLELTFRHARGNDLWLHIRGRPGAHVIVPVQPGKSVPLETLLDAATLAVYYSGGQNWGKTEVDYTFKKYVKRIKDSTEASYTQNKTLLIEPQAARLKRLNGEST